MADIVDAATRSRMMSGIRSRNTKPEMRVRQFLHRQGFRFRLHVRDLPGKPDIVLPRYRAVIFVHGCFWHRHDDCRHATIPASNTEFWLEKFAANIRRDTEAKRQLENLGWKVIVVWSCRLDQKNLDALSCEIKAKGKENGNIK